MHTNGLGMISCGIKNRIMRKGNAKILIRDLREKSENEQLNIPVVIKLGCRYCGGDNILSFDNDKSQSKPTPSKAT